MLKSMTGFARETAETPFGTLTCELRTVNHRYLDLQFRLPDELRAQETEYRQLIAAHLHRGQGECSLPLPPAARRSAEARPPPPLAPLGPSPWRSGSQPSSASCSGFCRSRRPPTWIPSARCATNSSYEQAQAHHAGTV